MFSNETRGQFAHCHYIYYVTLKCMCNIQMHIHVRHYAGGQLQTYMYGNGILASVTSISVIERCYRTLRCNCDKCQNLKRS